MELCMHHQDQRRLSKSGHFVCNVVRLERKGTPIYGLHGDVPLNRVVRGDVRGPAPVA